MRLALAFAASTALFAASAAAQPVIIPDVIGSTIGNMVASGAEHRCLSGEPPSADELAAARTGAEETIAAYVAAAGARERADVTAFFSRNPRRREWLSGGYAVPVEGVSDPLARALVAGGAGHGEPLAFVRSGDERTAQGLWAVRPAGASDESPVLGYYLVDFRKERAAWKITRLEIVEAGLEAKPVTQYCHAPGDVEIHLAAVAEWEAERERRRAERAAERERRRAEREARRARR